MKTDKFLIYTSFTQDPSLKENKICVEIYGKQKEQKAILIEKKHFSILKISLEYIDSLDSDEEKQRLEKLYLKGVQHNCLNESKEEKWGI